ncbi:Endonuclease/exonuclease/phosphatase [Infundibulicybe gibba]|nr:Endonuclease/exonuclease/phosphatase [Infundibulicybe gibba]
MTIQGRELFPTSTCLKAAQREHMIHHELIAHDADVLCLQEVDRLPKLLPFLAHAGYSHHYSAGPGKQHGCLIAFKSLLYTKIADRVIQYDTQSIRDGDGVASRGLSFQTKNIANIVVLGRNGDLDQGYIIATTHLFWHPRYRYERARQAGILFREVKNLRSQLGLENWPCIIAGDFNFPPDDVCYSLIFGDPLLPEQEVTLNQSRVVHVSVDPTVPKTRAIAEDGEDGDPDRVITSARAATPEDGLMTVPELIEMFSSQRPIRSAYNEGLKMYREMNLSVSTFGDRVILPPSRHGTSNSRRWSGVSNWSRVRVTSFQDASRES